MALFKSTIAKRDSAKSATPVKVVKSNGQNNISKSVSTKKEINIIPKEGQTRKTIKTYQGGQLVKKEKQGHDILGRETTKQKTYSGGKLTSVTKRVAGNNKDIKIVREGGKRQVSESPAMPKMKSMGTNSSGKKNIKEILRQYQSNPNATSCNGVFRRKNK